MKKEVKYIIPLARGALPEHTMNYDKKHHLQSLSVNRRRKLAELMIAIPALSTTTAMINHCIDETHKAMKEEQAKCKSQ